jgi:hypothetical protein
MLTQIRRRRTILIVVLSIIGPIMILTLAGPGEGPDPGDKQTYLDKSGDEELAYLLVKLEKKTRQVIAGHYGRRQSGEPEATATYKKTLIENRILPAAVADPIFSEVVPGATGGRAWVRMVVPEPRNPNNRGDSTALAMLAELQKGAESVWQTTADACYYGEPITAKAGCLSCHGEPAGEADPYFPQYEKNGWKAGEVVGAVVARVAPEK